MYDIIILGGGPAGCTAALYGARAGMRVILLEKLLPGGQMTQTLHIENYPGLDGVTDGITLGRKMHDSAVNAGAESCICEALSVDITGNIKQVVTNDGIFSGRTLIIATGAGHKKLNVPGEEKLTGKGVSFCAACDGNLYKNKHVGVIGGGNSAAEEALMLARICRKVTVIHRRDRLRADAVYAERIRNTPNIEIIWNTVAEEMLGNERLTGLRLRSNDGKTCELSLDGVFVSIGASPVSSLFSDALEIDKDGYIVAGEDTCTCVPGVFAAGDVRTKSLRQIVTAAADGAISAHFAVKYMTES